MRQISPADGARFRSNSTPTESNDDDDDTNAAENCETGSGCRNGCQPSHLPTISRGGEFLLPSFVCDTESLTTLSSSSSSGDATETGSRRTNCSTPPEVDDVMTSSAVRETAIVADSSDERLDRTGNCASDVITSDDVISGVIRQPLYPTNSSQQFQVSYSDLLSRDFVTRLDHGPETDILFSESTSDVDRKSQVMPEMETYLRLPPTLLCSRDVRRLDNSPATDAASQNRTCQADVAEYPEVNSTTSTATTTTMSLGRRSSSAGAINHVADVFPTLSSHHRHSSIVDRQRRHRAQPPPETEVHRRVTSPLDGDAALSARELRRARVKALANWTKLRQHFRLQQVDVDEPRFRAAALRLLENDSRRSRSTERQTSRRLRRASSGRDRRRCVSVERGAGERQRSRRAAANPSSAAAADNPAFHPDPRPRLSDPAAALPIHVSADSISCATVDLAAAGAALPYDYEPLSFDDVGAGGPFSYVDDPFDYDDAADRDGGKVTVPITICLVIIAGYIFAGAVLFTLWEDWDYLTGSYFCFITLSTIGFGDIVPGTDMDKWASSEKLVLCALWLAFGLSLLAMCFNLMQEEVKEKCKWIGKKLGLLKEGEDDR